MYVFFMEKNLLNKNNKILDIAWWSIWEIIIYVILQR